MPLNRVKDAIEILLGTELFQITQEFISNLASTVSWLFSNISGPDFGFPLANLEANELTGMLLNSKFFQTFAVFPYFIDSLAIPEFPDLQLFFQFRNFPYLQRPNNPAHLFRIK